MYTNGSLIVEDANRRSVRRWLAVRGPHTSVYVKAGMVMLYLDDSRPPRGCGCVPAKEWLEADKAVDFITLQGRSFLAMRQEENETVQKKGTKPPRCDR